ncbi:MAG: hypothetical protein LC114_11590 [Bryobacterales bacterium]|nr:hypothetical protein [Bryobacterales bacterium]
MAEPLYLSLWIQDFRQENMLEHFSAILGGFPFSVFYPGVQSLTIRAVSDAEVDVVDEGFEEPEPLDEVIRRCHEFLHDDSAYELTAYWDLWQNIDGEWLLRPRQVHLSCFGPHYENDLGDHIRLALGYDEEFLPVSSDPRSITTSASNLRSVARLAETLGDASGVTKRLLWSPSDENFLSTLEQTVFALGSDEQETGDPIP